MNFKRTSVVMTFLLKCPRLGTSIVRFAHHAKFSLKKKRILFIPCLCNFEINNTFTRSCVLAPKANDSQTKTKNFEEKLFQKSIAQLHNDIKFKGYIFREELYDAWQTLKSSTFCTVEQTKLLISSCGHYLPLEGTSKKLKLVTEIWDSFDDIGIKKTITHYNALLSVYVELGHDFCPKDFLRNLEKQGLLPNLTTYTKLIHGLCNKGKIDIAQELLEHMKMHSVCIDEGVFNCLILGYSLQGDFLSARGILELMKEKQLNLSSESYVNLAMGYAKQGDIEKVKEIVEDCNRESETLCETQFLELAYTFAVNGHSEQFSAILEMIPLKKNFPVISTRVVHRLLHQNLDEEALTLFKMGDRLQSVNMFPEPIQMFLDHYVRYRKPWEVVDVTELFGEKGWSSIAFAYCLKETLIRKDVSHCLYFIDTIKTRNYPVRLHYFYPILLKIRDSGNEEVLKIIGHVKKYALTLDWHIIKAFHRFYNFIPGAEFEDFQKLKNIGVDKELAAWKILQILLKHEDITNAIKLVSSCCVAYPTILLPFSMCSAFKNRIDEHENFVHLLYHLIHHLQVHKMRQISKPIFNSSDYQLFIFEIAKTCNKQFVLGVMKEMLKKKIPLSPSAASLISEEFPDPEIADLLPELTSKHLKFEFDQTLLDRLSETVRFHSSVPPEEKEKFSSKKVKSNNWFQLHMAVKNYQSLPAIMEIFENLTEKMESPIDEFVKNTVRETFIFASKKGDDVSTERIYEVAVQKNLIRAEDYSPCVHAHLVRGNSNDAVRRFHKGLMATGKCKSLGTLILGIKEDKHNFCALIDLEISLTKFFGKNLAMEKLLLKFAALGLVEEMANILRYKKGILSLKSFKGKCLEMFEKGQVGYFEILKEASWKVDLLSKTSFCYPLVRLYTVKKDLEKLLTLYVELEREGALEGTFRNVFFNSFENWDGDVPHHLQHAFECVKEDCEMRKSSEVMGAPDGFLFDEDIKHYLTRDIHSSFGTKVSTMLNINRENSILKCFCLIHDGKLDEYFKFLEEKMTEENPEKADEYFFSYKLAPYIINRKNNDKYEKLITMCGSSDVWKKYLKLCLRFGSIQRIKTAMKNIGPIRLEFFLQEVNYQDCLRVIEIPNSHYHLKSQISFFYYKVINECINRNDEKTARKYYERAQKHRLQFILSSFTDDNSLKRLVPSNRQIIQTTW